MVHWYQFIYKSISGLLPYYLSEHMSPHSQVITVTRLSENFKLTPTVSIWSSYATWFCVRLAIYPGLTLPCPVIAGPGKAEENWWMDGWRDGNHFSLKHGDIAGQPAALQDDENTPSTFYSPGVTKSGRQNIINIIQQAFKLSFTGYRNSCEDLIWLKYSA